MRPLLPTPRERVLASLRELTADGWTTSVRSIAAHGGFSSSSGVHYLLHALKAEGLAEQHPREPRLGWKAVVVPAE